MGKRVSHSQDGGALASRPVASVRNSVPLKLFMLNFNRSTKVLTMDGTLQIKPENLLYLGKYLCTVQFQLSLSSYGKKYPNHVMFRCQTVPNCDLLCKICSTRGFYKLSAKRTSSERGTGLAIPCYQWSRRTEGETLS